MHMGRAVTSAPNTRSTWKRQRRRHAYRADADRPWESVEIILSADMMKITLLPVLPLKECIFSPRIIAYNETFAVVMPEDREDKMKRK